MKIFKNVSCFFWNIFRKKKVQEEQVNSKETQVRELLESLLAVLGIVDDLLKKKRYDRTARRRFWEDFRKSEKFRKEMFEELIQSETIDKLLQRRKDNVCIKRK